MLHSTSIHLANDDERPRLGHPTEARGGLGVVELRAENEINGLTLVIPRDGVRQARALARALVEIADAVDDYEPPAPAAIVMPEPPPAAKDDEDCPF